MKTDAEPSRQHQPPHPTDPLFIRLQEAIDHAAHLLPAQGPITVFIHHNTLHGFEDLPFTEAVEVGAALFGCEPYLPKMRYRHELDRGRIRRAELEAVLRESLGRQTDHLICLETTRYQLRLAMMQYPLRSGPTEELLWFVAETNALRRIRSDVSSVVRGRLIAETRRWAMRELRRLEFQRASSPHRFTDLLERFDETQIETWTEAKWEAFTLHALWRICCDGVEGLPSYAAVPPVPVRHCDLLLAVGRIDADLLVNDILIPFCAAFLDQGLAQWSLPHRDDGFIRAFCALYCESSDGPERWRHGLAAELARLQSGKVTALESIHESLQRLGIAPFEWDRFLTATLLALRGWGGMIRQIEAREDRVVRPIPPESVAEFLAVRLILDRLALAFVAREHLGFTGQLEALRGELRKRYQAKYSSAEQRAFQIFQLAQVLGWTPPELQKLSRRQWSVVFREIEAFSEIDRRRIFHLAYEQRFLTEAADALSLHAQQPAKTPQQSLFQAIFCIDEREESIRRHLEEIAPDAATFGTAGFFAAAIYYRGIDDAHFVPLCPPVIRPLHWIVEQAVDEVAGAQQRRTETRRTLGILRHRYHVGSRSVLVGAIASAMGVVATVPLVARTLFPRFTARIRRFLARFVQAPPLTGLVIERTETTAGPGVGQIGFTLDEMTSVTERVLCDIGLKDNFARLVFIVGHGSTSMNNPHESAHDCGACGGSRGGPNARTVAQMLNDPRIRKRLAERGIVIPPETVFIGGQHNTSSETMTFFDTERIPESHQAEFESARSIFEMACDRNAHERCRRFRAAPLTMSFVGARQHVEGRAEDLAQVRPEWGHASNAICIVGRRKRTRGLFLDRRAFLVSYDPTQDDADAAILTRTLAAVFPVCAGINLEYYFSYVDPVGYGCGTKLPHNITSLLGVMDGAASDLRTGLPWQMVEIHEPVRLFMVIESTAETLLRIMNRNADIGRLIRNEWVHLAILDPDSNQIRFYRNGSFHKHQLQAERLPAAESSADWYRGWREHLEFAVIKT